jgi:hypothetical protein
VMLGLRDREMVGDGRRRPGAERQRSQDQDERQARISMADSTFRTCAREACH